MKFVDNSFNNSEYQIITFDDSVKIAFSKNTDNLPISQFRAGIEKPCMNNYYISSPMRERDNLIYQGHEN
jgi:hypothetical protein